MEDLFDYAEVVINTCTGDTAVVTFDEGNLKDSMKMADQMASIVRVIARSGLEMSQFEKANKRVDWFKSFPPWSHITFVAVAGRNALSGDTLPYEMHSFGCVHTTVNEEATG